MIINTYSRDLGHRAAENASRRASGAFIESRGEFNKDDIATNQQLRIENHNAIMPHSVSPGKSRSPDNAEDEIMQDAPATNNAQEGPGVRLEEMFDDDDDDEFPASSAPAKMDTSEVPG